METLLSFGLEIVVGLLILIVFLQHRRMNLIENQLLNFLKNQMKINVDVLETVEEINGSIDTHTRWIQRVESELQTKKDEDQSDVQLLQEGSKKVH